MRLPGCPEPLPAAYGADSRTRTCTGRVLTAVPLPLGYIGEMERDRGNAPLCSGWKPDALLLGQSRIDWSGLEELNLRLSRPRGVRFRNA